MVHDKMKILTIQIMDYGSTDSIATKDIEKCLVNSSFLGYCADSLPIHDWMGCGPHLNWNHVPSNGGWGVSQHGVIEKIVHLSLLKDMALV